ncbi:hypothetical protein [Streptomyces sp. NPDC050263]|uniref:hypothetical protein n=1 Tax=Streptomyces sp. NPDC050263 TaxID=3155037 RepID=UPI003439EBC4
MLISGYARYFPDSEDVDGAVYDGWPLVERPGFWAAHFLNQSVEDEELVTRVWGVDRAVVREAQDLLNLPTAWPAFTVDLGGGANLAVVYRNFEDDAGVDYLLVPGPGVDCIRIATLEGEYEGPGISWPELLAVAGRVQDPARRAATLVLLSPMLGDAEAETDDGLEALAEALRATGADEDVDDLAGLIASENLQWEPAAWSVQDGVTVCDAESSPRNPESVSALGPADLRKVSELLAP